MADPPDYTDPEDEARMGPESRSMAGTPRWVKVFGIVALVVVVLFVVLALVGGGKHGPGRHAPGGGSDPEASGSTPDLHLA